MAKGAKSNQIDLLLSKPGLGLGEGVYLAGRRLAKSPRAEGDLDTGTDGGPGSKLSNRVKGGIAGAGELPPRKFYVDGNAG